MKKIQKSDHFKISTILLFALPSIGMQIVENAYQIADGFFISNYIGESAFEAENLIFPPLYIVMAVGIMFGTGASALMSKELGEGHKERANHLLSMIISVLAIVGVILAFALYMLMPSIASWVGTSEKLMPDSITYGRVLAIFFPFEVISMSCHSLLITADRPGLGLVTTIANATLNIFLDWLFVAGFGWGMQGAASATGLAWMVSAIIPLIYFFNKKHPLHFTRPCFDLKALGKSLYNGASEMVDAISYAVVALIFNLQLLKYLGEDGVGAYAVAEYVGGMAIAVFYGISMSMVPVVGYHLGQRDEKELKSLKRNGLIINGAFGILTSVICLIFAKQISSIFVGYNTQLTDLSAHALRIIAISFMINGITTFCSSYFTGLNQGTASLVIALMKGFIGPLLAVFILPLIIGNDGIWFSPSAAEILTIIVCIVCFLWWRTKSIYDIEITDEE